MNRMNSELQILTDEKEFLKKEIARYQSEKECFIGAELQLSKIEKKEVLQSHVMANVLDAIEMNDQLVRYRQQYEMEKNKKEAKLIVRRIELQKSFVKAIMKTIFGNDVEEDWKKLLAVKKQELEEERHQAEYQTSLCKESIGIKNVWDVRMPEILKRLHQIEIEIESAKNEGTTSCEKL